MTILTSLDTNVLSTFIDEFDKVARNTPDANKIKEKLVRSSYDLIEVAELCQADIVSNHKRGQSIPFKIGAMLYRMDKACLFELTGGQHQSTYDWYQLNAKRQNLYADG